MPFRALKIDLHADSVVKSISRYLLVGPTERLAETHYVLARTMRVIMNQRLVSHMLASRQSGVIDFQGALWAMQNLIEPQDFFRYVR